MSAGFMMKTEKKSPRLTKVTGRIENTTHRIGALTGTTLPRLGSGEAGSTAGPAWPTDPDSLGVSQDGKTLTGLGRGSGVIDGGFHFTLQ